MKVILEMSAGEALNAINANILGPLLEHCNDASLKSAEPVPSVPDVQSHTDCGWAPVAEPVPVPETPAVAAAPTAAFPAPAPEPVVPAVSAVPTESHTYTRDELSLAAGQLMQDGKQADLLNLLHSFGVQALTQLDPAQFGSFATSLRGLGAKI